MKNQITIALVLFLGCLASAQEQLDIQGNPNSTDTVAKIRVNYTGLTDNVIGLSVISNPNPISNFGIGGSFFGGFRGIDASSTNGIGVSGRSSNHFGVYGTRLTGSGVYGVSTEQNGVSGSSTYAAGVSGFSSFSYGVYGYSTQDPGVYGSSFNDNGIHGHSANHFGVYGSSDNEVGVSGFSTNFSGVRGWSNNSIGVVGYSGNASSYDFNAEGPGIDYGCTSSRRWKRNIVAIPDPLDKMSRLNGVYFDWDEAHGGHHDLGFIAEEVGKVLPEIVAYEENGIDAKGMDYSKMTPLLVEAMNAMRKEYQEKLEKMELQIRELQKEIRQLQSDSGYTDSGKIRKKNTPGNSR